MRIVFASNSRFGELILETLIQKEINIDFLATASDKKRGRGQEIKPLSIKEIAKDKKIEVLEVDSKEDFQREIEKVVPDLVIVVGFSIIINKETLQNGLFINVHPSLLPKYRGSTPIQTAIKEGDTISGVTIIKMDEEIDHGPIIDKKEVLLDEKINYIMAEQLLANVAAEMLRETLNGFKIESFQLEQEEQNEKEATYTKKLTKEEGAIDWNNLAINIERKIRAFNDWPGTYTYLNNKRVNIVEASCQEQTHNGPFGECGKTYLGTNNTIAVQTGGGFLLIEKLQVEGKNITSAEDFIRGNIEIIGSVFSSLK